MLRAITAYLFRAAGWKIIGRSPQELKKAIWAGAPHNTNWDFIVCMGGRAALKMPIGFLAKSQLFKWYSGWIFRALGCYPVYRNQSSNLVDTVSDMFHQHGALHIAITPEGTRKDVDKLKTGFYYIALKANVPVILIGFNYPDKAVVISEPIHLTGNFQEDMPGIYNFYLQIPGKQKTWLRNYAESGLIQKS